MRAWPLSRHKIGLSCSMQAETSLSDRGLDSAFLIGRIGAGHSAPFSMTMRFIAPEVNSWIGFAALNGVPHRSAHMPRSRAPISMLTADCGAGVLSATTAIGAVVRVKSGSMSSGKNRERGANM